MKAYHGNPSIKTDIIDILAKHRAADIIAVMADVGVVDESAESAARSAWSAAWIKISDKLIELIQAAPMAEASNG